MKLVEPVAVMDCYADGLGAVQILRGGNVRFTLYVEEINEDGETVGVIVQKTVMSVESVPEAMSMAWATISSAIFRSAVKVWPLTLIH